MNRDKPGERICSVCGGHFAPREVVAGEAVREGVAAEIRREYPDWKGEEPICLADLARYRAKYVHTLLRAERGELSALEHEVLESLEKQQTVASHVDRDFEQARSFGDRLADRVAEFGGSWAFLISFGIFMAVWIVVNSLVLYWRPIDPFPYILLNLLLSCLAAIQAPVIMMSQNRQEAKDRLRARNDYQVNLKAELEIRQLHEKMDHLLSHQWERLVQIQEVQLDLLDELRRPR